MIKIDLIICWMVKRYSYNECIPNGSLSQTDGPYGNKSAFTEYCVPGLILKTDHVPVDFH